MNPYKIKIDSLKESLDIKDPNEVLKLKLVSEFKSIISEMSTEEVLKKTKLDKSDLSRLRAMNTSRFTLDRLVNILNELGYTTSLTVKVNKVS